MNMMPLGLLAPGEKAEILAIKGESHGCRRCTCQCRLESLGLREGKTVEVLNNPGHGPLLVKVDESRLALGRGVVMKVSVRRMEE
jgi:ferrous iron transport protein A